METHGRNGEAAGKRGLSAVPHGTGLEVGAGETQGPPYAKAFRTRTTGYPGVGSVAHETGV